jgi:nitronate monooxygenase
VLAPLAGGPSTAELAAAVSGAGGLGFLAAGYKTAQQLQADIARTRELTAAAFAVNVFMLADGAIDEQALARFAQRLAPLARRFDVELGSPRFDDDALEAKLAIVCAERPAVVSFTFGCPSQEVVERLHEREIAVWVTVTEPAEARLAAARGADALVVQGAEAGGHRGSFTDADGVGEIGLLALLRLVAHACELPLVATGGIADGFGVAAVLAAGARAAQIGTAFMCAPEAGTNAAHRELLAGGRATALTRAFTGRRARGLVNEMLREYERDAPAAYPHVHHMTAPLRAAARGAGDPEAVNLWAGQAHALAEERPAAELVGRWSAQARAALERAAAILDAQRG